ncbi:MAG: DUF1805 domain-containing protein [Erysipelotrichia bacterium]|nr:DUF1805 domain-containing protein [Erysipelotrichia bacterium]NCC54525.1 DUF1805 domain-containing protein [Erysipelotrichia bacterium]
MLEWKTIRLANKQFIGMLMILPKQNVYIISSTKCILVGNIFAVDKMTKSSCVFIMSQSHSFEQLLTSNVVMMNEKARKLGYQIGMSGKEVLLYQTNIEKEI